MNNSIPESFKIQEFTSSLGGRIFSIPMEEFPILIGQAYVVLFEIGDRPYRVLIDSGSGFGESNQHLEDGFRQISEKIGCQFEFSDLTHIFITHGHIDHFGGLSYVRPRTKASILVHELDLRNLANYEERLVVVSRRLDNFLIEAGVEDALRQHVIALYKLTKGLGSSIHIDQTYNQTNHSLGPFDFLHVPGHCPGHVVIRLGDVLFSGDHVLEHISPHLSPEHLSMYTGLGHYLSSLDLLKVWVQGIRLTLGGHGKPIFDLGGRIEEIHKLHLERSQKVLEFFQSPKTVFDISNLLFGEVHGYNVLLALEEAGAHVEYLYQHGNLEITNLSELENNPGPIAIQYRHT